MEANGEGKGWETIISKEGEDRSIGQVINELGRAKSRAQNNSQSPDKYCLLSSQVPWEENF